MNEDSDQIQEAFSVLFNIDILKAKLLIKVLTVLIEILDAHRIRFSDESLFKVNRRSLEILNIAYERLENEYVIAEQVQAVLSEWLGVLTAKTPEYIIILESLVRKAIIEDKYDFIALSIIYDILHDSRLIHEARKAKSAYRIPNTAKSEGTKDLINDYMADRVVRANSSPTHSKSGNKPLVNTGFKCFISNEKLLKLFNCLVKNGLLSNGTFFEVFQEAFLSEGEEIAEPMVWSGKTTILAYLLHMLHISQQQINSKWQNHFGNVKKAFISK